MSDLQKKIKQGEGLQLDFKFEIEDQKKIARTLVAFANAEGGSLLIGVKDNGKIVGTNPEEEFYMIEGAAMTYCKPPVEFERHVWQEDRFLVLEIIVPKSSQKHKAVDEEGRWKSYIRIDDHSLQGNKILDDVWRLEKQGASKSFEFDNDCKLILDTIKQEDRISLSKLYRLTKIKKQHVDSNLALLVYWGVVQMDLSDLGTEYLIRQ